MAALGARATSEQYSHCGCCGMPVLPFFGALRAGFRDLGYVEGKKIRLEHIRERPARPASRARDRARGA